MKRTKAISKELFIKELEKPLSACSGKKDKGWATTLAIGEEAGDVTTMALGEECFGG